MIIYLRPYLWSTARYLPVSVMLPHALLLLTILAGYVSPLLTTSSPDCSSTTYVTCQRSLNSALNITNPQPWFTPEVFRAEVENYYQNQGVTGIRKVCKAFRQFKTCMGSEYSLCMNPAFFVTIPVPPFSAYQFVSLFNQMHYICGAGLQTYLSNEKCMSKTWSGFSGEQLNACRYAFEQKSNLNPDQSCILANAYANCFEQQFRSEENCGKNSPDSQFWGCEYARVNVFTRFPQCSFFCILPKAGGIVG